MLWVTKALEGEGMSPDETLSLLVKPVSADYNMRCAHCFYRREDDPYRAGEPHLMDDRTLRTMIAG
jgi:hypothetical protein